MQNSQAYPYQQAAVGMQNMQASVNASYALQNQPQYTTPNPAANISVAPSNNSAYACPPPHPVMPNEQRTYTPAYSPDYGQGYNPDYNQNYNPSYNQSYNPGYNPQLALTPQQVLAAMGMANATPQNYAPAPSSQFVQIQPSASMAAPSYQPEAQVATQVQSTPVATTPAPQLLVPAGSTYISPAPAQNAEATSTEVYHSFTNTNTSERVLQPIHDPTQDRKRAKIQEQLDALLEGSADGISPAISTGDLTIEDESSEIEYIETPIEGLDSNISDPQFEQNVIDPAIAEIEAEDNEPPIPSAASEYIYEPTPTTPQATATIAPPIAPPNPPAEQQMRPIKEDEQAPSVRAFELSKEISEKTANGTTPIDSIDAEEILQKMRANPEATVADYASLPPPEEDDGVKVIRAGYEKALEKELSHELDVHAGDSMAARMAAELADDKITANAKKIADLRQEEAEAEAKRKHIDPQNAIPDFIAKQDTNLSPNISPNIH